MIGLILGALLAGLLPAPPAAPRPPARRMVCDRAPVLADAAGCDDLIARADWCEARLDAATRTRPSTAPPEARGIEDPAAWNRRLGEILAACDVPTQAVVTDCDEYPCVSALQGLTEAQITALNYTCGAQMGLPESAWPALLPMPVTCGDHTETVWMFAVVDQTTIDLLYPETIGDFLPPELLLLAGRRSEALARRWRCEEGAPDGPEVRSP